MLPAIKSEDIEGDRLFDGRDEYLARTDRHSAISLFKIRTANGVVDDIGAMASGFFTDIVSNILCTRINHVHWSSGMATISFACAFNRKNSRAGAGRELNRRLPHLSVTPAYQYHLVLFRQAGATQPFIGRDERHADGTGLKHGNRCRFFTHTD